MQPEHPMGSDPAGRPLGLLSFVAGILALFSVIMIALTSLLPTFNPPDWIRIATMAPLPFALVASFALGAVGIARQSGRGWAIGGLTASALVIVGFVVLLNVAG